MKSFFTAVPLFDRHMAVEAYYLMIRDGDKLFDGLDDHLEFARATLSPGIEILEAVGVEPFAGRRPLMLAFNQYQLLMGMPATSVIPPESLICLIDRHTPADEAVLARCQGLREQGYVLALEGVPDNVRSHPLAALCSYILVDYQSGSFDSQIRALTPLFKNVRVVICNIPDKEAFDRIGMVQGALYSGPFYSSPVVGGDGVLSPLKINALSLLSQINREDFDLGKIAETVEQDPSLSISLLRFINSAATGITQKIESIRGAVAILGQREVRRWASVAISVGLAEDRPGEITRLSLIRAKFAENLASGFGLGMLESSLFMAGLFSMLDIILDKPMEQAIAEIAVDERVRLALVDHSGPLWEVLHLAFAYEQADWDSVSIGMVRNGLRLEDIGQAFLDALIWYKRLLERIDDEYEGSLE